jgi:hypothetical protein
LGSTQLIEVEPRQHKSVGFFERNYSAGPSVRILDQREFADELARLYDPNGDRVPGRRTELHLESSALQQMQSVSEVAVVQHRLPAAKRSRPEPRRDSLPFCRSEGIKKA